MDYCSAFIYVAAFFTLTLGRLTHNMPAWPRIALLAVSTLATWRHVSQLIFLYDIDYNANMKVNVLLGE